MVDRIDITNKKFGLLTARNLDHVSGGQEYWLCECECGRVKTVRKSHLLSMRIRSCGCLYSGKKRGHSEPNTYTINGDVVCGHDFKGNTFFLSLQDFELVRPYKWYQNHDGYVVARMDGKTVTMHRFLIGQEQALIDHKNRNKADNRRENIRTATPSENGANKTHTKNTVAGVYWMQRNKKYISKISKDRKQYNLGLYRKYEDAVKARLQGELTLYGDFAPQKHLFEKYGIEVEA